MLRQAANVLLVLLAAVVMVVFLPPASPGLAAQQSAPVMIFETTLDGSASLADAGRQSRLVRPRHAALEAAGRRQASVVLPLPGMNVIAQLRHFEAQAGGFFAAGPIVAVPVPGVRVDGEVSLTVVGEVLVGRVVLGDEVFVWQRVGMSDWYRAEQVDLTQLPREGQPIAVQPDPAVGLRSEPVGDSNAFVDLLIVYTPAARAQYGGQAGIEAEATGAVNNANLALANSGAVHRYRLAHITEVGYLESGNSSNDLSRLRTVNDGYLDEVHGLRDTYKGDVVTMLTQPSQPDVCGVGYLMGPGSVNTSFNTAAFNVTIATCANAGLTLAHEIGHNIGLHHDRANASSLPSFDYAYGYAIPGFARTVMAYACTTGGGCPRRTVFSSPNVPFPGSSTPAGTATEDNARAMNQTSVPSANFRDSSCSFTLSTNTIVVGPSGGTGSVGVTTSSGCAWNAVSSDPTVVTVTGGSASNGSGNASYSVSASSSARSATLTIAGQPVSVTQTQQNYTINVSASPSAGGTVSGAGTFAGGSSRTVTASPNSGFSFASWTENGNLISASSSYTFTLNANRTLVANFVTGRRPTAADFDGDGRSDPTVFRPSTGTWYALESHAGSTTSLVRSWGLSTDMPVAGDYDGDGTTDIAVYRSSTGQWFILQSSTNFSTSLVFAWGNAASGDVPVVGDYDGDGKSDPAVFRTSTREWLILQSSTNYLTGITRAWGLTSDKPAQADYDGDNRTDIAVFRPSTGEWFILQSSTNYTTHLVVSWGLDTDVIVPADYDGDGKADPAVYRPSTGNWFILHSSTNYATYSVVGWGATGDQPVVGDWDGDGRAEIAVFRPSTAYWFMLLSSTNYSTYAFYSWGSGTDFVIGRRQ